jgi:CheY-like chemotaxis protein
MDVQMPEMDGVQATQQILERWADAERPWIVAMTAEVMRGDREGFLAAGMNDYVAADPPAGVGRGDHAHAEPAEGSSRSDGETRRPSVDDAVLQRLAEKAWAATTFVAELIDQFVTDSPALVAAARRSRRRYRRGPPRRPHAQVQRRDVRHQRARRRSSRLEAAAKAGSLDDGPAQLPRPDDELWRVHTALRAREHLLARGASFLMYPDPRVSQEDGPPRLEGR